MCKRFSAPNSTEIHPTFLTMGILFYVVSAGKAEVRQMTGSAELWRCLGVYMVVIWIAPEHLLTAEETVNPTANINLATIIQIHCPLFIWVEGFILNISWYTIVKCLGIFMGYARICNRVVISEVLQEFTVRWWSRWHCLTWWWWYIMFFLRKQELLNLPKGKIVFCMGEGGMGKIFL